MSKNVKWTKSSIKVLVENLAIAKGYSITAVTQNIDRALPPTSLSSWMDSIGGHSGGWFHRVKHGHDFAANVGKVYSKFGLKGVAKFPLEIARDATTPHGVPIPGTEFLVKAKMIGAKTATKWLSINVGHVFAGGVAIHSTYKLYKKSKSGKIDKKNVFWASIGMGVKIVAGVKTAQPILILSGIADGAILIKNYPEAKDALKDFFDLLISNEAKAAYTCVAVGTGTAASAAAIATTIGTASTGVAISGLSGAAAKSAMLAYFGGGSLASGGLGVLGGTVILSGGAALVGIAAAYGAYHWMSAE